MRALILVLCTLATSACEQPVADAYPGDGPYRHTLEAMAAEVRADRITLDAVDGGRPMTRDALCAALVRRHFHGAGPPPGATQAAFLACPDLDERTLLAACEDALANPRGHAGPEGWRNWAGRHRGTWQNDGPPAGDGRRFDDRADWDPPRKETTRVAGDTDTSGQPRQYDFQEVHWPRRRVGRHGWNQSHPDVPWVWGWDPKDQGDANGDIGTHLGTTFSRGDCHFILWLTPREAFLEGIDRGVGPPHPKTSTGFFGRGQWRVR
ncbi:MAG TPA: hypothetical protein VLA56_13775 [Pseudomonadales bacterium]|nr:hypothetical protein [Pseudomonadales bacterium]